MKRLSGSTRFIPTRKATTSRNGSWTAQAKRLLKNCSTTWAFPLTTSKAMRKMTSIPYQSMPYVTSYFQLRKKGDRPAVVPKGSQNLAFLGNFAESPTRDTVFTTEYSVRTAMEAVYTLFNVDRGVPEVFDSVFDIRQELRALYYLSDKKTLPEMDLPVPKLAAKTALRKLKGTWIEEILKEQHLLD